LSSVILQVKSSELKIRFHTNPFQSKPIIFFNEITELPPPYPGLPREMDGNNLPYNPYYNEAPPASAPSMK